MTDWRPIETAPKTGGGNLLGFEAGPRILLAHSGGGIDIGFWNGRSWDDGDWHDDMGEFTHWAPLPDLPK